MALLLLNSAFTTAGETNIDADQICQLKVILHLGLLQIKPKNKTPHTVNLIGLGKNLFFKDANIRESLDNRKLSMI